MKGIGARRRRAGARGHTAVIEGPLPQSHASTATATTVCSRRPRGFGDVSRPWGETSCRTLHSQGRTTRPRRRRPEGRDGIEPGSLQLGHAAGSHPRGLSVALPGVWRRDESPHLHHRPPGKHIFGHLGVSPL